MSDALHPSGYEKSDADPRLIGSLALGIAIFLIGTPFLLLAIYPRSGHDQPVADRVDDDAGDRSVVEEAGYQLS